MKDPHHRAYAAIEAAEAERTPRDKLTADLVRVIKKEKGVCPHLQHAWDLFTREDIRIILDAFLLGGALFDVMSRVTGVPYEVLKAYREYIFDIEVFRSRIEAYSYVNEIRQYVSPQEASFLQTAITGGPERLQWLLSQGRQDRPQHTPVDVLETMMIENMYKALSARGVPLTSQAAKVGLECSKAAIQAAANLQRLNPADDQDALAELKLTLRHEDRTLQAGSADAPHPDDILH